jgi:hypothetical protein
MATYPIPSQGLIAGSAQDVAVLTGEFWFQPTGDNYIPIGSVKMHKLEPKVTTKTRERSARGGFRVKTDEPNVSISLEWSIEADEQTVENQLFQLFATRNADFSQGSATGATATFTSAKRRAFSLGAYAVTAVVLTSAGPVTYVNGTDYTLDAEMGMIYILDTGSIADGTALTATFNKPVKAMASLSPMQIANRTGNAILAESDLYGAIGSSQVRRIVSGACQLYPSAWPQENGDFSMFSYRVLFFAPPTVLVRPLV